MYCIGHHIISPLGNSSTANFKAVQAGHSELRLHTNRFDAVESFVASLFAEPQSFCDLCVQTIRKAAQLASVNLSDERLVLILSTTKGEQLQLWQPALRIAQSLGCVNQPIVVSNACTSGVCAIQTAKRLLDAGLYDTAVVIGCDLQSKFIVSGFQSFKALSPEPCKPFDKERIGLNLGEAAACMIFSRQPKTSLQYPTSIWQVMAASNHNDANHISGPSRTGEGSYRCLMDVLEGTDKSKLAFINVHGTATNYNDEMESIALQRAELLDTPVTGLKGYYGHTMGAAGLLETIISMLAVENKVILATRGFSALGTSAAVNVSAAERPLAAEKTAFIKLLSGFGGSNAAIRMERKEGIC